MSLIESKKLGFEATVDIFGQVLLGVNVFLNTVLLSSSLSATLSVYSLHPIYPVHNTLRAIAQSSTKVRLHTPSTVRPHHSQHAKFNTGASISLHGTRVRQ